MAEKDIQLKVIQLHSLEKTFQPIIGSVDRILGVGETPLGFISYFNYDASELDDFLLGNIKYFTSEQKRVSDLTEDGYIDEHDLDELEYLMSPDSFLFADVNGDGLVNVVDVIALVNQILGSNTYDEAFDVNDDGIVNVVDAVALVNLILTI